MSCNQQNNAINCNFRQASSKHLMTLEPNDDNNNDDNDFEKER